MRLNPISLKFCVRVCEKMFATKTADKVSKLIMLKYFEILYLRYAAS